VDVLALQVVHGDKDTETAGYVENEFKERGERVEVECSAEKQPVGAHEPVGGNGRNDDAEQAVPTEECFAFLIKKEIQYQYRKRYGNHYYLGINRRDGLYELIKRAVHYVLLVACEITGNRISVNAR
jgi:hypothetical protein